MNAFDAIFLEKAQAIMLLVGNSFSTAFNMTQLIVVAPPARSWNQSDNMSMSQPINISDPGLVFGVFSLFLPIRVHNQGVAMIMKHLAFPKGSALSYSLLRPWSPTEHDIEHS
ncbi:hypothetical protein VNO77_16125 [Canavalia gladiata]|uniref:Uncharacterized protein n=1 Tax=Canavalia gladiata TaxID=3824 RepID=A0AAN9M174_CANGL